MDFIEALEIVGNLCAGALRERAGAAAEGLAPQTPDYVEVVQVHAMNMLNRLRQDLIEDSFMAGLYKTTHQ